MPPPAPAAAGREFFLSGRSCVVGDGVCLLADRSALAGSASRMIDLVRVMVKQVGFRCMKPSPWRARIQRGRSGFNAKGKLEAGADADLVVLSPKLEVVQTFVAGERIFHR